MDKKTLEEYNEGRIFGPKPVICYAPFKNLYLTKNGDVCVCCYTRYSPVGNYSKQTLKEIWEGEPLRILREHIIDNDLSFACDVCRKQMESKNFTNVQAIQYDEYELSDDHPVMLEFELDNTCNLECVMCNGLFSSSIRKNREHKSETPGMYNSNFVQQLYEYLPFVQKAKFLGGEPFLINVYYEIWDFLTEHNPECKIPVQTNGTVLNDKIRQLLDKGKFFIGISIDSFNREMYEFVRKGADFDTVMRNISYFIDYANNKDLPVNISVCPMQINIEQIPEIVDFCNNNNIEIYFNSVPYPPHLSMDYCTPATLDGYYKYLSGFHFETDTYIKNKNNNNYQGLLLYIEARKTLMAEYEVKILKNADVYQEENRDINGLIQSFYGKLTDFCTLSKTNFERDYYIEKLDQVFKSLPYDIPLARILKNMINHVSIGNIVADLEYNSNFEIAEKIKAISVQVA